MGSLRVALAAALAGALSAPLWFPGLQVISISHRESEGSYVGLPMRALALLFSQGYYGLPTGPHPIFQMPQWKYYEAVSYVGVIAVVLAVVAIGTSIRRPVVAGLALALFVSLSLTYQPVGFHPLQSLVNSLPYLKMVRFERMRTVSAFLVAMLGALGLEQLMRAPRAASTRLWLVVGATVTALVVAYLDIDSALMATLRHQRFSTLVWPTISAVVCIVVAGYFWQLPGRASRSRGVEGAAAVLLVLETGFLFFSGVGIASYSTPYFQVTPPIARLKGIVGDALVGLNGGNVTNVRSFRDVGFYPNVNIGYSIRIFGVHDHLVPAAYFTSWPDRAAAPNARGVGLFVPDVNSVALARRYGIAYVLSRSGVPAPKGMPTVAVIAGETLSRVPGARTFSFISGRSDVVLSSSTNGNGSWKIVTSGATTGELALRVTALPGMRASLDGKPLPLSTLGDVMLRASVPPGRHVITLKYLPRRLEVGVALALCAVFAMMGVGVVGYVPSSRRRRRTSQTR